MPSTGKDLPQIAIVIPTLNERKTLPSTIASCRQGFNIELLIVDGGSTDGTADIAREAGVRVLTGKRGRGTQLNLGAQKSRSNTLLFLHADTLLPSGFDEEVKKTLSLPGVVLGAFRLRTDFESISMRIVELIVNFRSRFLQMPYGDQAFFVKRKDFINLGGFAEIPLMEDFEFARRARKHGSIRLASSHVITSGRRWKELGVWQTTIWNQLFILGFLLGISPEKIYSRYRQATRDRKSRKISQ